MIKKISYAILLILFFSNSLFAKSPPPGTGTGSVPANILIMLDNSGSMSWDTDGNVINASSSKVSSPIDIAVDSTVDMKVHLIVQYSPQQKEKYSLEIKPSQLATLVFVKSIV